MHFHSCMTSKIPNKNYIKGRRKEYEIVKKMKEQGCEIAQRSAGSHSPIDVFAINREAREIYLIQSKPKGYNEKKIIEACGWLSGQFQVFFEVV